MIAPTIQCIFKARPLYSIFEQMNSPARLAHGAPPEPQHEQPRTQDSSPSYSSSMEVPESVVSLPELGGSLVAGSPKYFHQSFAQLENDRQLLMECMIREEIKQQGKMSRKMSLDDDEACVFSSDAYRRAGAYWRNREISQLTTKRLDSIPLGQIIKVKLLKESPMAGYNLLRVTAQKETADLGVRTADLPSWFGNILWMCLASAGLQVGCKRDGECEAEGYILKKSQFLGNWELRYVTVSAKNGLASSVKKDKTPTLTIKQSNEIWSRFEILEHQGSNYVVVKTWGSMLKCELGIPVEECVRWARALATLVR